jgi:hypothetical protein
MSAINIRKSPHGVLECEHYAREFAVHISEYFWTCVRELNRAEGDDDDADADLAERALIFLSINDHVLFDLLMNNDVAMNKIKKASEAISSLRDVLGLAGDAKIATGDNYHAITIL